MKLIEAIDAFPTLRGIRAGVDQEDRRSWFYDERAFTKAALPHGSGAYACACFVVSVAGHTVPLFTLAQLFEKIDGAHQRAALHVFAECLRKGGLK